LLKEEFSFLVGETKMLKAQLAGQIETVRGENKRLK
jgi:hypothetical protein